MEGKGLRFVKLMGIPVTISPSWFLIFIFMAWSLATWYYPGVLFGRGDVMNWILGLVSAFLLFVSVLFHEMAHSLMARRHDVPVREINLHIFGGVSMLSSEPQDPKVEWKMAVVGPLCSFFLALVFGLLYTFIKTGSHTPLTALLYYLAYVNLVLGGFNLVPGFPLDGGRVLRALLWLKTNNLQKATRISSAIGTGIAYGLMLIGFANILRGEFIGGMWLIFIGFFLRQAAEMSYQQLLFKKALTGYKVKEIMIRNPIAVSAETTLERLVEDYIWNHRFSSFPILEGGRVKGIISLQQVKKVPRSLWPAKRVHEIMKPIGDDLAISPEAEALEALEKLQTNGVGRLAVIDRQLNLVGYLSMRDLFSLMRLKSDFS